MGEDGRYVHRDGSGGTVYECCALQQKCTRYVYRVRPHPYGRGDDCTGAPGDIYADDGDCA